MQATPRPTNLLRTALLGTAIVLLPIVAPISAVAGGTGCSSSKSAEDLVACDHCHTLKEILGGAASSDIELRVHTLQRGVVIELAGSCSASVALANRVIDELWSSSPEWLASGEKSACDFCVDRARKLAGAEIDKAVTERGALVVLLSDDEELASWLQSDARFQKSLLEVASAN